jgi:DEAD/DEAH box helicase
MALNEVGPWLMENPAFMLQLETLTASTVADDLGPSFEKNSVFVGTEPDWGYLLLCGSFLATSISGPCQAAALRIAHSCLTDPASSVERKDSAALLLDTLANHPAVDLAVSRELLKPALKDRLPLPARIEWTRRSIEDSISLGDRSLRVNRFQRRFWKAAAIHEWLSVSAPTSAGKSFIVSQWVTSLLASSSSGIVIYLVPTRALISQVERDMRAALLREKVMNSEVISTPVRSYIKENGRTVLVFTQERLHILMAADPELKVDALVVDEAHKIGDRTRGVLLQQVIEGITSYNPGVKVIFASPMSSNPETLISDVGVNRTVGSLTSDDVMVSQNLIWVSQMPRDPINWRAQLCLPGTILELGRFKLPASPLPLSKRLPFVAAAIGANSYGNVIYVNGAADAEKAATQLYDLFEDISSLKELDDLIALCTQVVHPEFLLQKVLRRGIAFHYGNLPLILREEIERLFTTGVIRHLICTSTLVEGVNMSCRNIFIRGPKRGKLQPMTQEDFWNLAGRAGRWGKEFQGNIVCVDASDSEIWGSSGAPRTKAKYQIHRATDSSMGDLDAFLGYIDRNAPAETRGSTTRFEATFSYLCSLQERHGSIGAGPWAKRYTSDIISRIDSVVAAARSRIQTPALVVQRNPGISPFAMDLLLAEFRTRSGSIEELIPASPGSNDAVDSYVSIFGRCARTIAPSIGPIPARQFSLALLVAQWMRGYQLSRLIVGRLEALRKKDPQVSVAKVIRSVMEDVEQIARFEAPRVMACYRDLLQVVLREKGRQDLIAEYPDLSIFLEYGVAQETQISLITSGLSRTSTIALSELIASHSLSKEGVREWLLVNARIWQESSLSPLVKREITAMLPQP